MTDEKPPDAVREMVREGYGGIARNTGQCCGGATANADAIARRVGYSEQDVQAVPAGANLGLGCGNPLSLANVQPGETVVDLGSGAGFDALLAARVVGSTGHVIGIDMTPEMLARAKTNARTAGVGNVEFRRGYIEALPIGDASVDVVISNCVINLSPDETRLDVSMTEVVLYEVDRLACVERMRPWLRHCRPSSSLQEHLPDAARALRRPWVSGTASPTGCAAGALPR